MIRKIVFWLHLSVAVAAGAVILMMAATGVVLSLEESVLGLAERRHFVAAGEGAARLTPEAIMAAVEPSVEVPFSATSLRYRSDPRAPVRVDAGRDRYAYVDSHGGQVLGIGPGGLDRFFEAVRAWHRWFDVSAGSVRRARAVTGAVNVAFLFLLLTGPVLWLPRPITKRSLASALLLRREAKGAWRDLNWHQVAGIWSSLPLVVIAATGVTMSYPAVGDRAYPVVGQAVPVERWVGEVGVGMVGGGAAGSPDLATALAEAEAWVPGWRTLILNVPRADDAEVRVEVRRGRAGQPQRNGVLTVDAAGGTVTEWESFADDTPGRRGQQFLRFSHTGEYWGLAGQLLAGLFSLMAALMVWTGLSLAIRRLRRFTRYRRVLRG